MVGLRFDRFHDRANDYLQSAWSPKTGLVYQLIPDQLSAFINYQNGFRNVAPSTLSDDTRLVFSPEQANQIETGFKFELLNGKINGTVSYYDIKVKDRVRSVFDENNEYISVQDGTQTSKGVEFDIIANPFEGFHIIMGYGYNDSRFEKVDADMEDISGKHPLATPMNSANYWASYKFSQGSLEGFGLGIGGNYSGDYYFDDLNTITIDGFHTLNASIFYEQSKFRIGLKMNNLTDQQYWSAAYWAVPQKTRTILANISFKF